MVMSRAAGSLSDSKIGVAALQSVELMERFPASLQGALICLFLLALC